MDDFYFLRLADEALAAFDEIAETASAKLSDLRKSSVDSFAIGNTFTGAVAYENLTRIQEGQHDALKMLCNEPAIMRVLLEDDQGNLRVIYISRLSSISLSSGKGFASYRSELGRCAEVSPGDDVLITLRGREHRYWIIEKTSFKTVNDSGVWDSRPSQYRHYDEGAYSIESLRALLKEEDLEGADELDRLLEEAEAQDGVVSGISHQVRTAMGLRDQPILDQFQGEIFRLPLNSQLMILGPPGTGKTTTLIKRLGQKRDMDSLDAVERKLAESISGQQSHQNSWLMFTPSELLKHYLKEAFSREQIPASDAHIRTWTSYRDDIARNSLGVLRTANGGRFSLRSDAIAVRKSVAEDASAWFDAFREYHESRLRNQLVDGISIVSSAAFERDRDVVRYLDELTQRVRDGSMMEAYRALDSIESDLKQALARSKEVSDELLKKERNWLYNNDKGVFQRMAKLLENIQQDGESDDDESFDEDDQDGFATSQSAMQGAVRAYLSALKALARNKYLKRSMPKKSRSGLVIRFLGSAIPDDDVLVKIGKHISFQNGLRRFVHSHKRYVYDAMISYQNFRKDEKVFSEYYLSGDMGAGQLSGIELDAIILLMLQNSRSLMEQGFVMRNLDQPKYSYLHGIEGLFKSQIMVDEATDFSMLELACMERLASPKGRSFFACGDFNQRITTTGIRNRKQLGWVSPALSFRTIQLVYRQSRKLNDFCSELLRLQGGDLTALGKVPEESNHEGVAPVLCEKASEDSAFHWIAERIIDVERAVQQLPTIAVLVNSEQEVKPTAERLTHYLEGVNLKAVACEEGKALGEGTDVRVFDVKHIKGLEFEAVFFVGIDRLAEESPDLFDRFLYVGATRAATYLGLVCEGVLPEVLSTLRPLLRTDWS